MPATLPTVRSGSSALYPVERAQEYWTGVVRFQSGHEQRWKRRAPLQQFELRYTRINQTDKDALKTFFDTVKGQFDSTFQFTLSSTYQNLTLLSDEFQAIESSPGSYGVSFKFRQTITGAATAGAGGGSYPAITAQLPCTQIRKFQTTVNDNPTGKRYSYGWFGSGLTGFPTRGLMGWEIAYSALNNADADTLEAFFALQSGRWGSFSFTDPDDATAYPHVRFGMEAFERRYLGPDYNSVIVRLDEFNA